MKDGQRQLYHRTNQGNEQRYPTDTPLENHIWLRSIWGLDARCHYAYSINGKDWHDIPALYTLQWGNYRGDRLGLFTYNSQGEAGETTFTNFSYISSHQQPEVKGVYEWKLYQ